jgi:hypothetical protein
MDVKRIGGVSLFRPGLASEQLARKEAEQHLREGYPSGDYSGREKVNEILRFQFDHFYRLLRKEIPKTASRHLLEFVLGQYDATVEIEREHKTGCLTGEDRAYWGERGPVIRRALKHLAEMITMLAPPEVPELDSSALLLNLDTIVIYAEMLVELYSLSDQTHGVHPNDTVLTICPEGRLDYLELKVKDFERYSDFPSRVRRDTERQQVYLPGLPVRYDLDFQAVLLDEAFQAEFGFSYKDAIRIFMYLIDNAVVPDRGSFDIPFVRREHIVEQMSQMRGWLSASIDRLLTGFSLTKSAMEGEGRVIYKPKQEYRALRRGFFEMPHPTGPHLAWSRRMARECLFELMKGTVFQRCPTEWRGERTNKAFASLQNRTGDWFEGEVARNLASVGMHGMPSLKGGVGVGAARIAIPDAVGEIDYLGYLPADQLLIVLEDKMVDGGFEPTYFRDDISSFVTGKKPYAQQLGRKVAWVRDNLATVCNGLSTALPGNPSVAPKKLAGALVTLHPTYASYFIPDFPCNALTELMEGFAETKGWPYAHGVIDVT